MNLRGDKYVRFNEYSSENLDSNSNRKQLGLGFRKPSLSSITSGIRRGFERGGESLGSITDKIKRRFNRDSESFSSITDGIRQGLERGGESLSSITDKIKRGFTRDSESSIPGGIRRRQPSPKNNPPETKTILDPQGSFLQRWNKIFVLSCIIAVSLDPLFFYIPVIIRDQFCLSLDKKIQITACVLRSLVDVFYIFHIVLQFRTGFIAPSSRVFGRGELVHDSKAIAKRYLCSYFIIDILSILPLPQVGILLVKHVVKGPVSDATKELLKAVIFIQYIPRFWRIYPLYQEVTTTSGIFTETAWAGAAFNLFLYMLASHVLGAFWYLFAIERKDSCWREACWKNTSCNVDKLYCHVDNSMYLNSSCALREQNELNPGDFDFGIVLDALRAGVAEHENFSKKFFFCFWWGLRNLR